MSRNQANARRLSCGTDRATNGLGNPNGSGAQHEHCVHLRDRNSKNCEYNITGPTIWQLLKWSRLKDFYPTFYYRPNKAEPTCRRLHWLCFPSIPILREIGVIYESRNRSSSFTDLNASVTPISPLNHSSQ